MRWIGRGNDCINNGSKIRKNAKEISAMKRIMVILLAILLISMTVAGGATVDTERKKIGISLYYLRDEYYNALQNYFYQFAEEAGYDIEIVDADTDPATQQGQIEDFIIKGVDIIAMSATNPEASIVPISQAVEAGIPVLTFDGGSESKEVFTHVGFDSYQHGQVCGEYAVEHITKNLDGKAQVAVINYPESADIAVKRENGFVDAVTQLKGVEVVSIQSGDYQRTKSMEVMENILTKYPDVKFVFGVTAESSLGAVAAIEAAQSECVTATVGWGKELFEAIENGDSPFVMMATFTPESMARMVIDCITAHFAGETVAKESLIAATPVSVENIKDVNWRVDFE